MPRIGFLEAIGYIYIWLSNRRIINVRLMIDDDDDDDLCYRRLRYFTAQNGIADLSLPRFKPKIYG